MKISIVIEPPLFSPIIADPTFLSPCDTSDGKLHLFAHSIFGIHHYISIDGLNWSREKIIKWLGVRPFIYKDHKTFYLFFEKLKYVFPFTMVYRSEIQVIESKDLITWSKPKTVFKPNLIWHGKNVSNPCIVKTGNMYGLYYNANLKYFWDCLFPEPRYSGYATSKKIDGEYQNITKNPSVTVHKVLRIRGDNTFETRWYVDDGRKSRSKLLLNGNNLILPDDMRRRVFVYVADGQIIEGHLYIYFNFRNGWFWGKERIGLAIIKSDR